METLEILLRPSEVARRLSMSKAMVYQMMAAGVLPVVHIGRAVRVPARDLELWVQSRTSRPKGQAIPQASKAEMEA